MIVMGNNTLQGISVEVSRALRGVQDIKFIEMYRNNFCKPVKFQYNTLKNSENRYLLNTIGSTHDLCCNDLVMA